MTTDSTDKAAASLITPKAGRAICVLLMNKLSAMKSVIKGSDRMMRVFSAVWSKSVIYWKTQHPMNNFLQTVLEFIDVLKYCYVTVDH